MKKIEGKSFECFFLFRTLKQSVCPPFVVFDYRSKRARTRTHEHEIQKWKTCKKKLWFPAELLRKENFFFFPLAATKREREKKKASLRFPLSPSSPLLSLFLHFSSSTSSSANEGHSTTRASGPTFAVPCVIFAFSLAFPSLAAATAVVSDAASSGRDSSTLNQPLQEPHRAGSGTRTGQASGTRARRRFNQGSGW